MRINELLKQIQKVALEEGINIKIIESKDIQNIKNESNNLLEEYFFFDKDYIYYQYCRLNEKKNEFYDVVFNFKDFKSIVFSFGLSIICENDKIIIKNRGGDLIPFLPLISKNISKKCLKKCVNFFLKIVHLLENYTGSKLVFQSQLVDELTKLNDLSHFFQKSKNIEPEMWSVIKLDQTITKIRKDFRKSYRYLLNKRSSFKYKVIDNKSKKLKEYFNKFRQIHSKSALYSTKSEESWQSQFELIKKKKALMFFCSNKDTGYIGAAFIYLDKTKAFYFAGAFIDRKNPIGHFLQDKIIEFLKKRKLKEYIIGRLLPNSEMKNCTDKDKNISLFKAGWTNGKSLSFRADF